MKGCYIYWQPLLVFSDRKVKEHLKNSSEYSLQYIRTFYNNFNIISQGGKRNPEASSTLKSGKWDFGMNAHVGVGSQSGLVHSLITTTVKIQDMHQFADLFHGEEKAIHGGKGYCNVSRNKLLLSPI